MSVNHYENFPVASILLPAGLRPAVHAIYAFARSADDLADEGDAAAEMRLAALQAYEQQLDGIEGSAPLQPSLQSSSPSSPQSALFAQLQKVINDYALPLQPFRDLLSAFKQDVVTTRYADFPLLLDYCRRSANPVGVLMLHLYQQATPENLRDSDAICSALQLINFWQDVAIDWDKQRIYLPQDDMIRFGVEGTQIQAQQTDPNWRALMQFEVQRAKEMLLHGAPLALRLPGRIGWELRMVVQGGLRIAERLEQADYDVFRHRPKLGKTDWLLMMWRAVMKKHLRASHS